MPECPDKPNPKEALRSFVEAMETRVDVVKARKGTVTLRIAGVTYTLFENDTLHIEPLRIY